MDIDIGMMLDFQNRPNLSQRFIISRWRDDVDLLGVVEVLIKKGNLLNSITGTLEDTGKII